MDKLVEQFEHLKVTTSSRSIDDDPSIKELIETYSKAVLDCTFFHENYLTENNFCVESAEDDIAITLSLLNAIVSLCASVDSSLSNSSSSSSSSSDGSDFGNNSSEIGISPSFHGKTSSGDPYRAVVNVFGIEFGECVLWRQGSLLYAFCSAKLSSDPTWVTNHQMTLLNYLKDGINYFHLMLSLRRNLISCNSEERDSHISDRREPYHQSTSFNKDQPFQEKPMVFVSAKDFNPSNMNELDRLLLQKQQIVGALGQELDELQQVLDQQELLNIEAQREIEQKMLSNPEYRADLEQALHEIGVNQERVREQQEANAEKKGKIEDCLHQLKEQQEQLGKQTAPSNPFPSGSSKDEVTSDGSNVNTLDLIDLGVLSDNHMLAMMYCGDMAFWFCKYSRDWNLLDLAASRDVFCEIRQIGISYLKAVKAAERVLKFTGWNCERAKELLNYFNDI